jgi:hypothetical protein
MLKNTINLNTINLNDPFLINDRAKKNYYEDGKLNEQLVIEDMKRIFVFTLDPYEFYVKTIVNNEITIQARSDKDFSENIKEYSCWRL